MLKDRRIASHTSFANCRGGLLFVWAAFTASLSAVTLEHTAIHRDPTMYYIAPSLTQLPNGDIIVGVREAHVRPPGRRDHVDPTARGVTLRSRDSGRTFDEKVVVDDLTDQFSQTQSMLITPLRNGDLLATYFSWGIIPVPAGIALEKLHTGRNVLRNSNSQSPLKHFVPIAEGSWTALSRDDGRTWTGRRPIDFPNVPPVLVQSPAVELPDGTLLVVGQDYSAGIGSAREWTRAHSARSSDGGLTWKEHAVIAGEDGMTFREPSLVRLKSGRLLSMLRTQGSAGPNEGYLYQCFSDDDGRNWSKPERTPMWGWPAHVLELKDGRLLCSYGYRRAPLGVRATLSHDGGKTWDYANEMVIRDDGGAPDLGYPTSIQLADGRVLLAYYINHEKPTASKAEALATEGNTHPRLTIDFSGGDLTSGLRYIGGTFLTLD